MNSFFLCFMIMSRTSHVSLILFSLSPTLTSPYLPNRCSWVDTLTTKEYAALCALAVVGPFMGAIGLTSGIRTYQKWYVFCLFHTIIIVIITVSLTGI